MTIFADGLQSGKVRATPIVHLVVWKVSVLLLTNDAAVSLL
jgi:hypothetical protein